MELDNQAYAQVLPHSDCVDGEESQEEWQLDSWMIWEAKKNEGDAITLIFFSSVEKKKMNIDP